MRSSPTLGYYAWTDRQLNLWLPKYKAVTCLTSWTTVTQVENRKKCQCSGEVSKFLAYCILVSSLFIPHSTLKKLSWSLNIPTLSESADRPVAFILIFRFHTSDLISFMLSFGCQCNLQERDRASGGSRTVHCWQVKARHCPNSRASACRPEGNQDANFVLLHACSKSDPVPFRYVPVLANGVG
jgi:hypothetical protein